MALNRMNRHEFFTKLADLDEDRIKKALWNLHWRASAQVRERIESELDPAQDAVRKRAAAQPPDPDTDAARTLTEECLGRLPGHEGFADFAVQIGAELPASTRDKLTEGARRPAAIAPG